MSLPVRITVNGTSFAPKITLKAGVTATATWDCPSASVTATGLTPALSGLGAGSHDVYLTCADSAGYEAIHEIEEFNVGFSHLDDPGINSLSSAHDWTAQPVTALDGLTYLKGLKYFCAASVGGLSGVLDLSGLTALLNIECYNSGLAGVIINGCGSLVRLVTESNNLTSIDVNGAPALQEFRSAFQDTGKLNIVPFANAYIPSDQHFCARDQILTGLPDLSTTLPRVQELWIWNTRQQGSFAPGSPLLDWILAHSNNYTSANLNGRMTAANSILDLSANELTTIDLTGCTGLKTIYLNDNAFSQATVDSILATVDGWSTSGGTLDLRGNPAPAASTHVTALQGRGWTVQTGPGAASIVQVKAVSGGAGLSFTSTVTAGNSVLYVAGAYTQSSATISASAPTLAGSAVSGQSAAFSPGGTNGLNSPFTSGDGVFLTAWLMPNCPAGNTLAMAISGAAGITGAVAVEIAGLGTGPGFHRSISAVLGTGQELDPGQMGATTIDPVMAFGLGQAYAGVSSYPGAPWTTTQASTPGPVVAYRPGTRTSGGESFNWIAEAANAANPSCAGLLVIG